MESEHFLNSLAGANKPSNELRIQFYKMVEKKVHPKHETILNTGQVCNHIWFLAQGFVMAYVEKDEKKIPYQFWNENEIIVPVNSFFKQLPADGCIEVLEKSTLVAISFTNFRKLTEVFPECNIFLCNLLQNLHYATEKRVLNLTSIDPGERYTLLLKESSFIIRKASVEMIAAYLGVSRKTLNRIRAKKN